jgi:hypothetical protein
MRSFRYGRLGCPGDPGGGRSVHPAALPALRRDLRISPVPPKALAPQGRPADFMHAAIRRARLAFEIAGRGCIVARHEAEPRYATVNELVGRLGDLPLRLPHIQVFQRQSFSSPSYATKCVVPAGNLRIEPD